MDRAEDAGRELTLPRNLFGHAKGVRFLPFVVVGYRLMALACAIRSVTAIGGLALVLVVACFLT